MANRILLLVGLIALSTIAASIPEPRMITPTPQYWVEDLGTLAGDPDSYAWGIDETGAVVGGSEGPDGMRAFLYTDEGGLVPLPCPEGRPLCIAREIEGGRAVGSAWSSLIDAPGHAVRWTGLVAEDLGALGGSQSEAWALNATGAVVGSSYTATGSGTQGFLYTDAQGMVDATPGDAPASLYDMNDGGVRAGYRRDGDGYRAYRWSDGVSETFGVLPGHAHSYAYAINERGQFAGSSRTADGAVERFIRYTTGVGMENLGGVYDRNRAWGINARGDVVGEGRLTSGPVRALLYLDGKGLRELNRLVDTAPGWFLMAATDINDAGQIVGYGSNLATGRPHAVRLTPNTIDDAPRGLQLEAAGPDAVRLSWSPVSVAEYYRIYESTDRFAKFPWRVLGQTTFTQYDAAGHLSDGLDHYYIVRAVRGSEEGGNSTVAAKVHVSFPYAGDRTNIAWFSLPYGSEYRRASDVAVAFGVERVDVVGKWDAARQTSIVYYRSNGPYRGVDFEIQPGDGLYVGLLGSFDRPLVGTDRPTVISFTVNPEPMGNVNWVGLPYGGAYRRASDIATEIGPLHISEIGRWDPASQSAEVWRWDGSRWSGTDFTIRPGDGIYIVAVASFDWEPRLLSPPVE